MSGLMRFSPNRCSIQLLIGERIMAQRRTEEEVVSERVEKQTDWTLIVQDRVTERIMDESHSVWLAIYWSVGLSSLFWLKNCLKQRRRNLPLLVLKYLL